MEKHALDPIIILEVNTSCCKECPEKLKKALLMTKSVNEVSVDPEKKLVLVRGNIDPFMLIQAIAKMGKSAELMFYDKEPNFEGHLPKNGQCSGEKDPHKDDNKQNVRNIGRDEHFLCHDDDEDEDDYFVHKDHGPEMPKNIHEEEKYKGSYQGFHRSTSTNGRMPSRDSETMFGNHSDHHKQTHFRSQSSRYDTSNSHHPRRSREEPAPYDHYHPRMPSPPPPPPPSPPSRSYGLFREHRPMSEFDSYHNYFW
ncbi:hypothetical protein ACH5RR_015826 [Cinchona calisaya]|uniref:HMA domain-containing protein n=1 Tax=Cinchona calisaya TaxID=153742 RepID=A0ABD2ZXV8_9GENT